MATMTMETHRGAPRFLCILLLLAIVVALAVITCDHAIEAHGSDATLIRKCIQRNGPEMIFKSMYEKDYYLLCKLPNGKYGVQVITEKGYEKTAFIPKDGSYARVMNYLNKFATRFRGGVPWR